MCHENSRLKDEAYALRVEIAGLRFLIENLQEENSELKEELSELKGNNERQGQGSSSQVNPNQAQTPKQETPRS